MSNPIAEVFSQGDEVLTGQIVDTNAAWLARQLTRLGFDLVYHGAVGDRLEPMVRQLRAIARRADLCVATGGLGPTVDDLTAAAVAAAFDRPLALDPVALAQVEAYFARRGLSMAAVNRKQAELPAGAQRIDNHWGTAPGFMVRQGRCLFVFLPGVPSEMEAMFTHQVERALVKRYALSPPRLVILRTFGLGESSLQQRLQALGLPSAVRLGFRAGFQQNEVKLLFPPDFPVPAADALVARAAELIGDAVFMLDEGGAFGGSLATVVGGLLDERGASLVTAETFTGGQLAWQCRGQAWLRHALVAPRPENLFRSLGCDPIGDGAGFMEQAARLADSSRQRSAADYALAVLGPLLPVGEDALALPVTAAIAVAGPSMSSVRAITLAGTAERRPLHAAAAALDDLRRQLMQE